MRNDDNPTETQNTCPKFNDIRNKSANDRPKVIERISKHELTKLLDPEDVAAKMKCLFMEEFDICYSLTPDTVNIISKDQVLRNRHQTGTTGGDDNLADRDMCENDLFGHSSESNSAAYPKYAALRIDGNSCGVLGALVYGPWYLIFKHHIKKYATMTFRDSYVNYKNLNSPQPVATFDEPWSVIMAMTTKTFDILIAIVLKQETHEIHYEEYIEVQIHMNEIKLIDNIRGLWVHKLYGQTDNIIVNRWKKNTKIPVYEMSEPMYIIIYQGAPGTTAIMSFISYATATILMDTFKSCGLRTTHGFCVVKNQQTAVKVSIFSKCPLTTQCNPVIKRMMVETIKKI